MITGIVIHRSGVSMTYTADSKEQLMHNIKRDIEGTDKRFQLKHVYRTRTGSEVVVYADPSVDVVV